MGIVGILGTLILVLLGSAAIALFANPDYLKRVLKALKWSVPGVEEEQTSVRVVLFVVAFLCYVAAVGILPTLFLTAVFFGFRFLVPTRR